MQELQRAQENRDYVFLTDILELQLLPVFVAIEERVVSVLGVHIDETLLRKNMKSCEEINPQLLYSLFPADLIKECVSSIESISDESMDRLIELAEQCINKGYIIEPASSGYYTMAVQKRTTNIICIQMEIRFQRQSAWLRSGCHRKKWNICFMGWD